MNAIPAGGGFSFSLNSIGGTWRWTVFASNLGLLYQVQDISTPYGPMNVAMIPLPADVVQAMAQSITDVKNQLKPLMTLVSSQTSFSVGVTEGDPRQNVGSVQIRNDGAFGSFLSAMATPDVPWLVVLTPEIDGLARGETATFVIDLVPDQLLAAQSPFTGHVRIQNTADSSSYIIVSVSVLVLPRPAISVNTQSVAMAWSVGTPTPTVQYITVANNGPGTSSLDFSIAKVSNVPWLTVAPESGGPLAAGMTETIQLSIVGISVPASLGEHVETVRISSTNASNSPVDVTVTLTVSL
jgi:hypothetical protein